MRCLTVRQPWASLIIMGRKQIETRSWSTTYRGPLVIHAGAATPGRRGFRRTVGPYEVEKDRSGLLLRGESLSWPYRLPLGCVVGVVTLEDVRPATDPGWPEAAFGDHGPGQFAWVLSHPSRIKHVTYTGRQGLWDFPEDLVTGDRYERKAS